MKSSGCLFSLFYQNIGKERMERENLRRMTEGLTCMFDDPVQSILTDVMKISVPEPTPNKIERCTVGAYKTDVAGVWKMRSGGCTSWRRSRRLRVAGAREVCCSSGAPRSGMRRGTRCAHRHGWRPRHLVFQTAYRI